jgi:hypothetical protein
MIISFLTLKDALNLCHVLHVPEQVAAQYCDYKRESYSTCFDLKENSYKFLLKNKRFQIKADSYEKTWFAFHTFDLELIKNFIEEVKPVLSDALSTAALIGFAGTVELLLLDPRKDEYTNYNDALINAAEQGHLDIVELLLYDNHHVWSDKAIKNAIRSAKKKGQSDIVKELKWYYYNIGGEY